MVEEHFVLTHEQREEALKRLDIANVAMTQLKSVMIELSNLLGTDFKDDGDPNE